MPFYPDDTIDYIREQRRREANRVLARFDLTPGDEVDILEPPADPAMALHEAKGIVVGMSPLVAHLYFVMCSLAAGREALLPFPPAAIRRAT